MAGKSKRKENPPSQFKRTEIVAAMAQPLSHCVEGILGSASAPSSNYDAVAGIFDLIMDTPGYKKQVAVIDSVLSSLPPLLHALLFHFTAEQLSRIPTDRKDKFFYLLGKTLKTVSLDYVCGVSDPEVAVYVWGLVSDKHVFSDWDDRVFVRYVVGCKPFILRSIKGIKIDKGIVKEYLDLPMNSRNREALHLVMQ